VHILIFEKRKRRMRDRDGKFFFKKKAIIIVAMRVFLKKIFF
jgi:hypothetical protein